MEIRFFHEEDKAVLAAHIASLPPMSPGREGGEPMAWDAACFIGQLAGLGTIAANRGIPIVASAG